MVIFVRARLHQRLVNAVNHNERFDNSMVYCHGLLSTQSGHSEQWPFPEIAFHNCSDSLLYGSAYLHQHCIQMILQMLKYGDRPHTGYVRLYEPELVNGLDL